GATIPVSLFTSAIPILDFLSAPYIKLKGSRCLTIIGTEGYLNRKQMMEELAFSNMPICPMG
ncbi:MAG: hypothetical protein ABSC60_00925, partial [Acidobacteriota bacterium]